MLLKNFINLHRQCKSYSKWSYIHHLGKEPLRALTLGQLLENTTAAYPEREIFVSVAQNERLTYKKFSRQVDKLAAGLKTLGLARGDRLGLWATNMMEWHVINLACARAGIIVVALNPAYQPSEIEYCINKVQMKAIVCPEQVKKNDFVGVLKKVVQDLDKSEPGKLKCSIIPSLQHVITIADKEIEGTFNYNTILNTANEDQINEIKESQHQIQPDSAVNIQFTSGTTGKPKAAVLSHFNIVNNSFAIGKRNELDQKHHKICVQVPFFHAFGYTITFGAALNFGATMVIPALTYDPLANLTALADEKCTVVHGTPTMYVDLINAQRKHNKNINPEIAVSGGSPCSPQLFKQMLEVLKVRKVKSIYGLTETTAVVFHSMPVQEDMCKSTETVGHVTDHVEAKIVDEDGNVVPFGIPGELYVRGYTTMLGYWGDEAKTAEVIGKDLWLHTGDQFILEENGYGKIVGRLKDMIIRGGENIYPKEIEDFLNGHPDILETQVIGLRHKRLGEEVCACVRIKEGSKLTLEDIKKFCKGKIAHFKIPSQMHILESFPKTQSGKIQKHILRQQCE